MARDPRSIDISDEPAVLRLVDDIISGGVPCVLRRHDAAVAVIRPSGPTRARRRRRATSADDTLWSIVGIADADAPDDLPSDVSSNVDAYLADAHDQPAR